MASRERKLNEVVFGILTGLLIVFVIALAIGMISIQGFIGLFLITANPLMLIYLTLRFLYARAASRERDEEES